MPTKFRMKKRVSMFHGSNRIFISPSFFIVNFFDTWYNIYCSCGYFKYTDVPKSSVLGGKQSNGRSSNTITNKYKGNIQQQYKLLLHVPFTHTNILVQRHSPFNSIGFGPMGRSFPCNLTPSFIFYLFNFLIFIYF